MGERRWALGPNICVSPQLRFTPQTLVGVSKMLALDLTGEGGGVVDVVFIFICRQLISVPVTGRHSITLRRVAKSCAETTTWRTKLNTEILYVLYSSNN